MSNNFYYAVANGRSVGIFNTWSECQQQVNGFKGAKYKKFKTQHEALQFIGAPTNSAVVSTSRAIAATSRTIATTSRTIATSSNTNINCKVPVSYLSKKNNSSKNSKDAFEHIDDDIHDELMKKMDEIEKDISIIKKNTIDKTNTQKKAIMIDPLPKTEVLASSYPSLKRPREDSEENDCKKLKTLNVIRGLNNYKFNIDESGYVIVYTDGACSNNGYEGARAGLGVYFGEDHPLNVSEPVSGRATNNCGEIQAATKAIKVAHSLGINKLNIKTDSKFVINSMTKWIQGWKRKGWKLANGEPVKNKIDFKELDEVQRLIDIKWEYVTAHKGVIGNERADQLAKDGATKYKNIV